MSGWIDKFRSLGESLFAVLRAEMAALQEDLTRSGRHLGVALGLMGGALIIFFGMRMAWRTSKGIDAELTGPYQVGSSAGS